MSTGAPQVAVAMPTRGSVCVETHSALQQNLDGVPCVMVCVARLPVDDARNDLVRQILEIEEQLHVPFALLVDDDAWWPAGTLARMLAIMGDRRDIDMLAAPACFRMPNQRAITGRHGGSKAHGPLSFSPSRPTEVDMASVHFALIRTAALRRIGPAPFRIEEGTLLGEDSAFCFRARNAGVRIFIDGGATVAHVEASTGFAFVPGAPALRVFQNRLIVADDFDAASFAAPPRRDYGAAGNAVANRQESAFKGGVSVDVDAETAAWANAQRAGNA